MRCTKQAISIREIGFYGLSLILMLWTFTDRRPPPEEEVEAGGDPNNRLYIHFQKAVVLPLTYIVYVIVLAKFDVILTWIGYSDETKRKDDALLSLENVTYGSVHDQKDKGKIKEMPFLRLLLDEPPSNFSSREADITAVYEHIGSNRNGDHHAPGLESIRSWASYGSGGFTSSIRHQVLRIDTMSKRVLTLGYYNIQKTKPSDCHDLSDIEFSEVDLSMSCFLWQRSRFYSKARVPKSGWNLRWFTFNFESISSVSDTSVENAHTFKYPKFNHMVVDRTHLTFKFIKKGDDSTVKKEYILMAPNEEVFDEVLKKCKELMDIWSADYEDKQDETDEEDAGDEEYHGPLTAFPRDGNTIDILTHFILFPLKVLIQLTLPDVRQKGTTERTVWTAMGMSLVWLVIGSYLMVRSLEILAELLNISEVFIGITICAAGTSIPNYVGKSICYIIYLLNETIIKGSDTQNEDFTLLNYDHRFPNCCQKRFGKYGR